MKKKQAIDLDQEYTLNPAAQARERERQRLEKWRAGAEARAREQERIAREEAARAAEPIVDRDELAAHVARLATAFGLKRKR